MIPSPSHDDAALATAAGAGSREALGLIYDRHAGALLGFCNSMLRDRAAAEDCLQDVFVLAATRLADLRQPERLRSWLFSVARHECLRRLDRTNRELAVGDTQLTYSLDAAATRAGTGAGADPSSAAALDAELAALIADASEGLSARDRLVLELADRQGLDGDDLAGALGVPRSTAYTLVARARGVARTSVGSLLVARVGRRDCPDLDALLAGWDGALTPLLRKQINRHVDSCEVCDERRKKVAAPAAIFGSAFAAVGLPVSLRERVLDAADSARGSVAGGGVASGATATGTSVVGGSGGGWVDGWPPVDAALLVGDGGAAAAGGGGDRGGPRRRRAAIATALALLLVVVAGGGWALTHRSSHRAAAGASLPTTTGAVTVTPAPSGPPTTPHSATSAPANPSATTLPTGSTVAAVTVPPKLVVVPPSTAPRARPTTTVAPTGLTVVAASSDVKVSVGNGSATCAAGTRCVYAIPARATVTIFPARRGSTFSGYAPCATAVSDCSFTFAGPATVTVHDP